MHRSVSKFETSTASAIRARSIGRCCAWEQSEIMLSAGGQPSSAPRREFDLYTHVDDVDGLRRSLEGKIELVQDLHETFYGAREFIIRDCNGFWITFGEATRKE